MVWIGRSSNPLKTIQFQVIAMCKDTSHQTRLLKAPYSLVLITSRDGNPYIWDPYIHPSLKLLKRKKMDSRTKEINMRNLTEYMFLVLYFLYWHFFLIASMVTVKNFLGILFFLHRPRLVERQQMNWTCRTRTFVLLQQYWSINDVCQEKQVIMVVTRFNHVLCKRDRGNTTELYYTWHEKHK